GMCTGAGWSPDGQWMYFTADVNDSHQVWRQRFPNGTAEQLTFGREEHDGISVMRDGSIVTSVGTQRTALWVADGRGERPLAREGSVIYHIGASTLPSFSPDGRSVFYLRESAGSPRQLWRADFERDTPNRCWWAPS